MSSWPPILMIFGNSCVGSRLLGFAPKCDVLY